MSYKISTGLRNHLAVTGSLRAAFNADSRLSIYAGTEVATADADATGATLLCVITGPASAGLAFEPTATSGVLAKSAAQTWSGTNLASGTATWFRLETLGDTRGASTSALRVQGNIGTAIGDMVMVQNVLTSGNVKTIDGGGLTFPAS
jgi:hypothetical protein